MVTAVWPVCVAALSIRSVCTGTLFFNLTILLSLWAALYGVVVRTSQYYSRYWYSLHIVLKVTLHSHLSVCGQYFLSGPQQDKSSRIFSSHSWVTSHFFLPIGQAGIKTVSKTIFSPKILSYHTQHQSSPYPGTAWWESRSWRCWYSSAHPPPFPLYTAGWCYSTPGQEDRLGHDWCNPSINQHTPYHTLPSTLLLSHTSLSSHRTFPLLHSRQGQLWCPTHSAG